MPSWHMSLHPIVLHYLSGIAALKQQNLNPKYSLTLMAMTHTTKHAISPIAMAHNATP